MQKAGETIDRAETSALQPLINLLTAMESAVIAYSGGVDSSFLLKAAMLSGIKTLAVTAVSPTMPEQDLHDARELAETLKAEHILLDTTELENSDFVKNTADRCFYCKDELFEKLQGVAAAKGYRFVLDGSNLDDMDDWRPGRKAALRHEVRSPLIEAGLRKQDIRALSRELKLFTWDKPASPCLSSRFPYGEPITSAALKQVEAAEQFLKSFGFKELRVRHYKDTARIELKKEDIPLLLSLEVREAITERLKSIGYKFVCLDLDGFRSGKLND